MDSSPHCVAPIFYSFSILILIKCPRKSIWWTVLLATILKCTIYAIYRRSIQSQPNHYIIISYIFSIFYCYCSLVCLCYLWMFIEHRNKQLLTARTHTKSNCVLHSHLQKKRERERFIYIIKCLFKNQLSSAISDLILATGWIKWIQYFWNEIRCSIWFMKVYSNSFG